VAEGSGDPAQGFLGIPPLLCLAMKTLSTIRNTNQSFLNRGCEGGMPYSAVRQQLEHLRKRSRVLTRCRRSRDSAPSSFTLPARQDHSAIQLSLSLNNPNAGDRAAVSECFAIAMPPYRVSARPFVRLRDRAAANPWWRSGRESPR